MTSLLEVDSRGRIRRICWTCAYWDVVPEQRAVATVKGTEYCRRFPPQREGDALVPSLFPETSREQWCGEWKYFEDGDQR